jgi:hypothetical protein
MSKHIRILNSIYIFPKVFEEIIPKVNFSLPQIFSMYNKCHFMVGHTNYYSNFDNLGKINLMKRHLILNIGSAPKYQTKRGHHGRNPQEKINKI